MKKRIGMRAAAIVAVVMMVGISGSAFAGVDDVNVVPVEITETIQDAFAEYGISLETLQKSSAELTQAEKAALAAVFGDVEIRGWLNGLINGEMAPYIDDGTVARMRVGGRVYLIGTSASMDAYLE